jgi:hypothetical protein
MLSDFYVVLSADYRYQSFTAHVINRLEEAASNYDSQYAALLKLLREKSDQAGGMVRFLTFRLDYNAEEMQRAAAVAIAKSVTAAADFSFTASGQSTSKGPTSMYGPDGRKLSSPNLPSTNAANVSIVSARGAPTSRGAAEPTGRRSLTSEFSSSSALADGAPPRPPRFSTSTK